jgi:hypothetical protein
MAAIEEEEEDAKVQRKVEAIAMVKRRMRKREVGQGEEKKRWNG